VRRFALLAALAASASFLSASASSADADMSSDSRGTSSAPAPPVPGSAGENPRDPRILDIVGDVSEARLEHDVRALAGFGTRHTLSDTVSDTRGIGAARRWLHAEFDRISGQCGGCLEVGYVSGIVPEGADSRIAREVEIANPVAVQRGRVNPDHYVLVTAHYDSRVNDPNDAESDAPGANDNASGVAGVLEVARLLSRYPTDVTIVYAPLAGEEQGLHGARILAEHAVDNGWTVEAVINNDMIGNSRGIGGHVDNTTVRVFAPGPSPDTDLAELRRLAVAGGELDVPSRQLARRVARIADDYVPELDVLVIYRLDRFGRSGDHRPFFERGFPAIRVTELHEDFRRQHQLVRSEDGVAFGDVPDAMDFAYLAKITALNAATLASIAWAPPAPAAVQLGGAVSPSARLRWSPVAAADLAGYRIYWRRPTEPQWSQSRWVGNVTEATIQNVSVDSYFFGVAAVDTEGNESVVRAGI
jgi:hypothetical protein